MHSKLSKILTGLICLLISMTVKANQQITDNTTGMINQKILAYMQQYHIPGAAVEVYVNGIPHSYYFGYADKEHKIPVTQQTLFEVGSITKVFTNILIAEQVNTNKIKLNDPVIKYLPDFSATANKDFNNITIQELATHTAGLPQKPAGINTRVELIQYCSIWKPSAPIGSQWRYSNMGIGILGYALEGLTHQNYNQLLIKNILQPLGMEPIGIIVPKQLETNYALGYDNKGDVVSPINMSLFSSAGAMKVSGQDMQLFLKAAIGLPGIPQVIMSAMRLTQTPYVATSKMKQGLAWEVRNINTHELGSLVNPLALGSIPAKQLSKNEQKFDGNALIEKTGSTDGFRAYIAVIPNRHSGIVILTNHRAIDTEIVKVGRGILLNLAAN